MKRALLSLIMLMGTIYGAHALDYFEGIVDFDRTVHDFGTVSLSDGPQSCSFTVTNVSKAPVNIFAVITTCGCTTVKWTRQDIPPGKKGTVDATFSNDEGEGAFDKTLKVYISDIKKPMILHLRGEAVK